MNRRRFLLSMTGLLSAGGIYSLVSHNRSGPALSGAILGASHHLGHRLRSGGFPAPTQERRVPVIIVGGGISGLSAGWTLERAGFRDFEILELEPEVGGNARFGENSITPYPWGAHYVPLPTRESTAVRALLAELGVIERYTASGEPVYDEKYLCFTPHERLYLHGKWQEGLLPQLGVTQRDLDQYDRFKEIVDRFRHRRGADGRKAFAIPMELSARDQDLLALDRISMQDFLRENRLDSLPLHWYVNYACRDDYGCNYAEVSAWAGLHYFAGRDGGGDVEAGTVLTWPEGNGWIVKQLRQRLRPQIRTHALVFHMASDRRSVRVDVYDPQEDVSRRITAQAVIFAGPTYLTKYLLAEPRDLSPAHLAEFQYAPWLVANLTLDAFPIPRAGAPLAWDNVIYNSDSLGYVVATHQSLRTHLRQTVFTYYYPLTGSSPAKERVRLLETDWNAWADFILKDLAKPHPEIRELVRRLDIFRWGHAMVRPRPGFIWGDARRLAAQPQGNIYFAHSDLSGFSIFEEAQYRGVLVAEQILSKHRVSFSSLL